MKNINKFKLNISPILGILSIFILSLFVFRSIIFNIHKNLLDWLDYPYVVWTIFQTTENITKLKIEGFFNTNIYYPHQGTLLFSDLYLPQSLVASIIQQFTSNPVLTFNIIFFTILFLNIVASYFFWGKIFNKKLLVFFATLITAFSPFIFLQIGHFQMLNIWPFLLGLTILFQNKLSLKKFILLGFVTATQFLISVYLSIFMLFSISLWFTLQLLYNFKSKEKILFFFKFGLVFIISFLILAGPFIYKYLQVKNAYGIDREYGEYITYAAHPTDYLFTTHYNSLISTTLMKGWNDFNKHSIGELAGFPGFTLLVLSLFGLFIYGRNKNYISLNFDLSFNHLYFLILAVSGFIFSLGPRLAVNGVYIGIPLPYYILLKLIPIFEPIRATSRWSLLFYLGLVYFAAFGLSKLIKQSSHTKSILFVAFASTLFIAEIIPLNKTAEVKQYFPSVYQVLVENCANSPKVLLEYPMTQFKDDINIITNLTYRTQMMLASVHHKCNLVNGYSGFIPRDYERYENELFTTIEENNKARFWELIGERNINFVKLNKSDLYMDRVQRIGDFLEDKENTLIMYESNDFLVVRIR